MYEDETIIPKFDAETFIEKVRNLEEGEGYDILEDEGYEVIPEIKEYFEKLEITDTMVSEITELTSDGGDEIYLQIIPFWDGEDDTFDVKSADDVKLLPMLKKASLLFEYPGIELIKIFAENGVILESI
ncbi:MAG: hypothetical protein N4A49_09685 [Marinifilaceae bacterium]|jgi:hypothetical protein|nr:hypothetical protein [Marinifilaceae bacterium]